MKKNFIKLFLLIGMLFIGIGSVYAADGYTFKIDGANVKVGDEFDVGISVSGPNEVDTLTNYNIVVSYDTNKLDLVSGNTNIAAQNQAINSDYSFGTIRFKAKASGNTNLDLKVTEVLVNGEQPEKNFKINANSGTVSIRDLGSDSTLKSLKIPNTVLSPEFKSDVREYTATVTDVTSITIDAKPNDATTTCTASDQANNLIKGENTIYVDCVAENWNKTTYTLKVTLNVTPTPEELAAQDTTLKALSIKGQKIDFNSNEKKYYVNVDYDVTKINITATPNNPEAEVTITGNSKFVVGKNTVKINILSKDKTKNDTYQIIVTREDETKKIVKTCPDSTSNKEWIIFTVSLLLTFTLGIVLGYFLCKKEVLNKIFKKKNKEEVPVEIETLSDTIDLSDTVKKVKNTEETKK